MNEQEPVHILVSRNDAVGDAVLAFPVCGLLKEAFPSAKVSFLGRTYTQEIALSCSYIDDFVNQDEWAGKSNEEAAIKLRQQKIDVIIFLRPDKDLAKIARKAEIPMRIGTTNRIFHWFTCNRLVPLSRKNSGLHEAQLNTKLLQPLGIKKKLSLEELPKYYGLNRIAKLDLQYDKLLSGDRFNLILHPKSHGNSLEWGLKNFEALINMLEDKPVSIFISGSQKESQLLRPWILKLGNKVTDISGHLSLEQFISFINRCDGLIAASTGPVHIAAACGIHALGLYSDIRTKEASRWGPIGVKAEFLECRNADMNTITPEMVYNKVTKWI